MSIEAIDKKWDRQILLCCRVELFKEFLIIYHLLNPLSVLKTKHAMTMSIL